VGSWKCPIVVVCTLEWISSLEIRFCQLTSFCWNQGISSEFFHLVTQWYLIAGLEMLCWFHID
jgi:hypothetical protein